MARLPSGDLSARAEIREAAADLFAEHGFAAVTVRQIAARAEVSPALVVHHFGSKVGLQAAVVEQVQAWFDDMLAIGAEEDLRRDFAAGSFAHYLLEAVEGIGSQGTLAKLFARLIVEEEPVAADLITRIAERSEEMLEPYVAQGIVVPDPDPRARMGVLIAQDIGTMLLRPQLTAWLGVDPLSPEGIERWSAAVLRVMSSQITLDVNPTTFGETDDRDRDQ